MASLNHHPYLAEVLEKLEQSSVAAASQTQPFQEINEEREKEEEHDNQKQQQQHTDSRYQQHSKTQVENRVNATPSHTASLSSFPGLSFFSSADPSASSHDSTPSSSAPSTSPSHDPNSASSSSSSSNSSSLPTKKRPVRACAGFSWLFS